MATEPKPLIPEGVEFYVMDDILSYFPEGFADDFYDNFLTDVSWGDAYLTLVDANQIMDKLHACWDEGNYGTQEENDDVFEYIGDLDGELVALQG